MKDIHSIGQAFKIVSERTAKRKTSKLITDGDSTIRRSITSQEFLLQTTFREKLADKLQEMSLDYDVEQEIYDWFLVERKQACDDTIKEIIINIEEELKVAKNGDVAEAFEVILFYLKRLGEGEKK